MFDKDHYEEVKKRLEGRAELCAVSKMHSIEEIQCAYDMGQRRFGENKAAELVSKANALPKDIEWHFIGHLQRNKVKQILPYVSCIESLDSVRLAETIEKEAAKLDKTVSCLLEFHLALKDENKTGLPEEEALEVLRACQLPHINIKGIMAMGPHTEDEAEIREVFQRGRALFERLQKEDRNLTVLSMGMSDDYPIAVDCGATLVRIGSYLFHGEP
ncbi:MAG: YggS family pyridoxal phosphate-dependent enzyme [Solobacterium sp.]|nr:YggS family pyridoxal phosphate-dependent enzyme [Solobacterium sp.]